MQLHFTNRDRNVNEDFDIDDSDSEQPEQEQSSHKGTVPSSLAVFLFVLDLVPLAIVGLCIVQIFKELINVIKYSNTGYTADISNILVFIVLGTLAYLLYALKFILPGGPNREEANHQELQPNHITPMISLRLIGSGALVIFVLMMLMLIAVFNNVIVNTLFLILGLVFIVFIILHLDTVLTRLEKVSEKLNSTLGYQEPQTNQHQVYQQPQQSDTFEAFSGTDFSVESNEVQNDSNSEEENQESTFDSTLF